MNLFISWSGERSRFLAEALHEWLPMVVNKIEPWISTQDIRAGELWVTTLTEKLSEAQAGLICLTPENLASNWIHYEAGQLRSTSLKLVASYLYEVSALLPPLSLFQAVAANEAGTRKLVRDLNQAIPGRTLESDQLDRAFQMWWPELHAKLQLVPARPSQAHADPAELVNAMSRRNPEVQPSGARPAYFLNHSTFLRPEKQSEFVRLTGVIAPHYDLRVVLASFDDPQLMKVERVTYHLHPSYPNPIQTSTDRQSGFLLKELANGEYLLRAEIHFTAGQWASIEVHRYISLWDSGPRLG